MSVPRVYRPHEFARLAGVTVRALHHYDRLGLLVPAARSSSGYRLYTDHDLVRLEQIVVFKLLGLELKDIRALLDNEMDLGEVLERQAHVLAEKRAHLDAALRAIEAARRSLDARRSGDSHALAAIIKEIAMQNVTPWMNKYYSPDARAKLEERKGTWNPELQAEVSRRWSELFADIDAALGEDPAGPRAQALAARWSELVGGFTGGDPEIQSGLNRMWNDQENWPREAQAYRIKPEIQAFIMKAFEAKRPR